MLTTGRIIAVESAQQFSDKKRRITIKVDGADPGAFNSQLRFPSDDWALDQEVEIVIGPRTEKVVWKDGSVTVVPNG